MLSSACDRCLAARRRGSSLLKRPCGRDGRGPLWRVSCSGLVALWVAPAAPRVHAGRCTPSATPLRLVPLLRPQGVQDGVCRTTRPLQLVPLLRPPGRSRRGLLRRVDGGPLGDRSGGRGSLQAPAVAGAGVEGWLPSGRSPHGAPGCWGSLHLPGPALVTKSLGRRDVPYLNRPSSRGPLCSLVGDTPRSRRIMAAANHWSGARYGACAQPVCPVRRRHPAPSSQVGL